MFLKSSKKQGFRIFYVLALWIYSSIFFLLFFERGGFTQSNNEGFGLKKHFCRVLELSKKFDPPCPSLFYLVEGCGAII